MWRHQKLAPFVLSKLWILVADWSMHWSRDTFLMKLRLYLHINFHINFSYQFSQELFTSIHFHQYVFINIYFMYQFFIWFSYQFFTSIYLYQLIFINLFLTIYSYQFNFINFISKIYFIHFTTYVKETQQIFTLWLDIPHFPLVWILLSKAS